MAENFQPRVRHVQAGDPVSAGVTSAAPRSLESRTNELKRRLDAAEAGRALVHYAVACAAECLVGQAVYWDEEASQYAPAIAGVADDPTTGGLVAAASADVAGLVLSKSSSRVADIVLHGLVAFSDLTNAIDDPTPGRYYLSSTEAGKLVKARPAAAVSVCLVLGPLDGCDQNTWVLVNPQMRDFLEDHVHYQVQLTAAPAGCTTLPEEGDRHEITDEDVDLPGWLPADHAIFAGKAPTGAKFGYNLAGHPALSRLWPPVPQDAVVLEMFKPGDGVKVGGRVPDEFVRFDAYGIWWMTACYGEVPWPTDFSGCGSSAAASVSSASSSAGSDCPVTVNMNLVLSFAKMAFATNRSVVTSLQAAAGQPLQFVNCDDEPATTGALFAKLALELLIADAESYGGQALKQIEENQFAQGWMVEGLIAGSDKVTLTSTRQRRVTTGDATTPLVHQELVTIDVDVDPVDRELTPITLRLNDTLERLYKGITYIGLPAGRDSGVLLRFNIPPTGLPTTPAFKLRVVMFGQLTGTLTDLAVTYYRLARPTAGTPTPIEDDPVTLAFVSNVAVTADEAIEIESEEIEVAAGDTLYVNLSRSASGSPVYASEIGLIRVAGVIVAEV